MARDELCERLRQADAELQTAAAIGSPRPPAEIAARVRRTLHQRKRARRAMFAAGLMSVLSAGVWAWRGSTTPHRWSGATTRTVPAAQERRAAMARLEAEATLQRDLARELHLARQLAAETAQLADLGEPQTATEFVAERLEVAAGIGVARGDRLRSSEARLAAAAAAYRAVVESFPQTRWAAVARERLTALPPTLMN